MAEAPHPVQQYWTAIEARDWPALGQTLAPDVVYRVPQTRELVRGRDACVRFNAEYPGDWHLEIVRLVAQPGQAASWIDFHLDGDTQAGLAFFVLDEGGLITDIADWWPEPYAPPPGREHLVERY